MFSSFFCRTISLQYYDLMFSTKVRCTWAGRREGISRQLLLARLSVYPGAGALAVSGQSGSCSFLANPGLDYHVIRREASVGPVSIRCRKMEVNFKTGSEFKFTALSVNSLPEEYLTRKYLKKYQSTSLVLTVNHFADVKSLLRRKRILKPEANCHSLQC